MPNHGSKSHKGQSSSKTPNSNSSSSDELWSSDESKGALSDGPVSGDEAVAAAGGSDNMSDIASANTAHTSLTGSLDNLQQLPSLTGSAGPVGRPVRKLVRSRLDCWSSTSPEPHSGLLGGLGTRISTVSECPQSNTTIARDVAIVWPCRLSASQVRTCDMAESVFQTDGFVVTFDGLWSPSDAVLCKVSVSGSDVVSGADALLPRVPVNIAEAVADQTDNANTLQGQQYPHALAYSRDSAGLHTGELGQEAQLAKDDVTGVSHVSEEMAAVQEMEVNLASVEHRLTDSTGIVSKVSIGSADKITSDRDTSRLQELFHTLPAPEVSTVEKMEEQHGKLLGEPNLVERANVTPVVGSADVTAKDDSVVHSAPETDDFTVNNNSTKNCLSTESPSSVARDEAAVVSHNDIPAKTGDDVDKNKPGEFLANHANHVDSSPVNSDSTMYSHVTELNSLERYTVDHESRIAVLEDELFVNNKVPVCKENENIVKKTEPRDVQEQDGIVRDYVVELHGLERYTVDSESGIVATEVSSDEANGTDRGSLLDDKSITRPMEIVSDDAHHDQLRDKTVSYNSNEPTGKVDGGHTGPGEGVVPEQQPNSQEVLIHWGLERYTDAAVSSEHKRLEVEPAKNLVDQLESDTGNDDEKMSEIQETKQQKPKSGIAQRQGILEVEQQVQQLTQQQQLNEQRALEQRQAQELEQQQQQRARELKQLQQEKELEEQRNVQMAEQQQQQGGKKEDDEEPVIPSVSEVDSRNLQEDKQYFDTEISKFDDAPNDIEMDDDKHSTDWKHGNTPENMTAGKNQAGHDKLSKPTDNGCFAGITDITEGNSGGHNAAVDQITPVSQLVNSRLAEIVVVSKQDVATNEGSAVTQVNVTTAASQLPIIDSPTGASSGGSSATVENNSEQRVKEKGQPVASISDSAHEQPHGDDCDPRTKVEDNSSAAHDQVAYANDGPIDAALEVAAMQPCDTREEDEATALGSIYGANEAVSSGGNQRPKSTRPLFTADVDIPGQSGTAPLHAHSNGVEVTCEEAAAVGQADVSAGLQLAPSHSLPSDCSELTVCDTARPHNPENRTETSAIVRLSPASGLETGRREGSGEGLDDNQTSSGEQICADEGQTANKVKDYTVTAQPLLPDGTTESPVNGTESEQHRNKELFAEEWVDQLEIYFPSAGRAGYTAVLEVENRDAAVIPPKVKDGSEDVSLAETPSCEAPVTVTPAADNVHAAAVNAASELPVHDSDVSSTEDAVAMETVSPHVFFTSVLMPVMEANTQSSVSEQVTCAIV